MTKGEAMAERRRGLTGAARRVVASAARAVRGRASTTTSAAKKATAKRAAPARKSTAKKSTAKKATAKKATATKSAPARKTVKKATAKKAAPAKKSTAKKATAKKATAKKAAAKKATAKKATAKKAPAKKATAKKAPAKKATAKKSTATRTAPSKRVRSRAPGALKVAEDESPWTASELAAVQAELEADVARLRAEIDEADIQIADLIRDSGDGAGDDQADSGSKAFEREHEMTLANNARDLLEQNERALRRIGDGTYGICESCGNAVGKRRLQAFPRATLCVTCKQRQERR